jgi:TolB-like protein
MRSALWVCLFVLAVGRAMADPVAIEAEGVGPTRDMAVSKALISAVEQATGVTIDATQLSSMVAASTVSGNTMQTDVVRATKDQIARIAGGRVSSYDIVSVSAAPEGGLLAHVRAQIEVFHAKGLGNENRRRIAVAYFVTDTQSSAEQSLLHDKLVQFLTQSRRFAVVDRSDDKVYEEEMAIVTGTDAAPAERTRAGQVLGADYVVTGHLMVQPAKTVGSPETSTQHTLELTGEVITNTTPSTLRTIPGAVSTDFKVIEIATRQVKFADHVELSGAGLGALAEKVANRITTAIYPPRLIDISDPTALIINQGGAGINAGQRFRVMQEGRELTDPYTHESLGKKEAEVGTIEVTSVGDKVTYAKLVSGAVSGEPESLVLRPSAPAPASPPPQPVKRATPASAPAAPQPTPASPNTGVKLPFDH